MNFLKMHSKDGKPEEMKQGFQIFDIDGSGYLSFEEFDAFMT